MQGLTVNRSRDAVLRVLCIGAHSDDIEIGCGGTLLKMMDEFPHADVSWIVFSATGQRAVEAQASAETFLRRAEQKRIVIQGFREAYFPYIGAEVKDYFEQLKGQLDPHLIFTHYRQDYHQDHRVLSELTWNTFREHLILEYEIPKYDGGLGQPNVYVGLEESLCRRKARELVTHFATQGNKHWFTEETFMGLMRLRGIESRSPAGYAEAFYAPKLVLEW